MREVDTGRIGPSPAVRASVSPDGLVLLDIRGGVLLASNPIGAHIWQLIEQRHTVAEIASQLVVDYDVSAARAKHDVIAFVTGLVECGLVTVDR